MRSHNQHSKLGQVKYVMKFTCVRADSSVNCQDTLRVKVKVMDPVDIFYHCNDGESKLFRIIFHNIQKQ